MKKLLNRYKNDFLEHLINIRGYSDLTIGTYEMAIDAMLNSFEHEEVDGLIRLSIMPFRMKIAKNGRKTIAKKLSAVRSFIEYLITAKSMHIKLIGDAQIKVPKTLPKPIGRKYINEALDIASVDERVIVMMLYTLGLRISELSSLKISSIGSTWVRVIGKGSKMRELPLLEETQKVISLYVEQYRPKEFLFEKEGKKLSENSLRYKLTKLFRKIGISVTPHQLRHSYATELLNNGARISDVSELLGHSSMATTQIYTKLGSALKLSSYNRAHPLAQKRATKKERDNGLN